MRALHLLAASLLLLAASCGGSADAKTLTDEGYTALNQGDHDTAFEQLGSARAKLDPSDPARLKADLGYFRAAAHVDPDEAVDGFLDLAEKQELQVNDYRQVGQELIEAREWSAATTLLGAGIKKFPGDPGIDAMLAKAQKGATADGASDALKALEGLGYVGSDKN